MANVTVTKQGPEAFSDNDRYDDLDYTTGLREYHPPRTTRIDWRSIVAYVICGCIAFIVLVISYSIWKTIYCWGDDHYFTCERINAAEPIFFAAVFGLAIALVVGTVVVKLMAFAQRQRAITNRTNLVLNRFGDQQPADLFNRLNNSEMLGFLIKQYEIANNLQNAVAPYQIYKGVNSLNVNSSTQMLPPSIVEKDEGIKPIQSSEWLHWINQQPHVILAGATGKGKTTTAKPIIAPRVLSNEQLLIIDPHSDYWFGLNVIGGGENWSEVKDAFEAIFTEYKTRHAERDRHLKTTNTALKPDYFTRLTVVLDEAFAASMHLSQAKRGHVSPWDMFSEVLGSGARKVNLSIILLTQTANVDDLGLSGPLRDNFTRIAVSQRAIKLMISQEEKDATRRQQLYEALIGMQYPATTVQDVSVVLLDRTGLDQIPDPIVKPDHNWPLVRPSGNGVNGQNGHSRTDGQNTAAELARLKALGITRDQARNNYGLEFSNDDWTNA